jgi:hypothetical protein
MNIYAHKIIACTSPYNLFPCAGESCFSNALTLCYIMCCISSHMFTYTPEFLLEFCHISSHHCITVIAILQSKVLFHYYTSTTECGPWMIKSHMLRTCTAMHAAYVAHFYALCGSICISCRGFCASSTRAFISSLDTHCVVISCLCIYVG